MIINDLGHIPVKFADYNKLQEETTQTKLLLEKDYFLQNIDPKEYAVHLGIRLLRNSIGTNIKDFAKDLFEQSFLPSFKEKIGIELRMGDFYNKDFYNFNFQLHNLIKNNPKPELEINFQVANEKYRLKFKKDKDIFIRLIDFFIKPIIENQSLNSFDLKNIYINFGKDKNEILEIENTIDSFEKEISEFNWAQINFNVDLIHQGFKNLHAKIIRNFFTLNKEAVEIIMPQDAYDEEQKLHIKVFIKNAFTLYPQMLYTNIIDGSWKKSGRPTTEVILTEMEWGNIQLPDINAKNNYFQYNLFEKSRLRFSGSTINDKNNLWNNFNEVTFKGSSSKLDKINVNFNYFELELYTKKSEPHRNWNEYNIYGFNISLLNKDKWTQIYENDIIELPYLSWWNPLSYIVNPFTYLINFLIKKMGIGVLYQFGEALKGAYEFMYQNNWIFAFNVVFSAFIYGLVTMRIIKGTINQFS